MKAVAAAIAVVATIVQMMSNRIYACVKLKMRYLDLSSKIVFFLFNLYNINIRTDTRIRVRSYFLQNKNNLKSSYYKKYTCTRVHYIYCLVCFIYILYI